MTDFSKDKIVHAP